MSKNNYLNHTKESHLQVSSFSHKGLVRTNNEDNLDIQTFLTSDPQPKQIMLAVLADGVGGHQAGEIASRFGVETITTFVAGCSNLKKPAELLEKAVITANQVIVHQSQVNENWKGMGSTCVCALIIDRQLYVANLGDSRLYLIRNRKIRQLTYDHTWLDAFKEMDLPGAGRITRSHPLAHVLMRYLGSIEPIRVDLRIRTEKDQDGQEIPESKGLKLQSGDILVLTSDGISDLLREQEIKEIATSSNWTKIAQALVYHSLKKGGYDNATAISIKVPKGNR